jgi:hypothetical protein
MNIEPRSIVPVILVLLTAAACTEAKPPKSEAIERAKPTQPLLTAKAPTTPIQEKKPAPPVVEVIEAPPVEKPQSFEAELESFDGLTIQRLVTAPEVERREPVAASAVFGHHDEKVYAFVEVSNESDEDKSLLVHFIGPDGQVSGGIELRIPAAAPRWRTWAYTRNATKTGLWRVEVRSEDGTLIGALPFEVEPGC